MKTTMKEFKVKVTVKVNLDEMPEGVEATQQAVAKMVDEALVNYTNEMADAVSSTGDWSNDGEAVASTMPEFEVK